MGLEESLFFDSATRFPLPSFISSCGFGFIRTSAPIRRLVPSTSLSDFAMPKLAKKKAPKPIDPRSVFHQAYHVLQADLFLRQKNNGLEPESAARASMILSAFELELLFKTLILLDGRTPPPTHRLDVLFRQLHNKHKRLIERAWETDPGGRVKIAPFAKAHRHPSDLPNAIIVCANAFEKMRYHYEDGAVYYLQGLPTIVANVILEEIQPDWRAPLPIQPTSRVR